MRKVWEIAHRLALTGYLVVLVVSSDASAQSEPPSAAGTAESPPPEESGPVDATYDAGAEEAEAGETPEFNRPKYQTLRQNEDWSGLADFDRKTTGDPYDVIKYVPLTEDGEFYLSFGGMARSRVESWQNFGASGTGNRDDTFWLNRVMLHGDVHLTPYLRGFIEGKSAFSTDRDLPGGIRSIDRDELDIQNGFVDLRLPVENLGVFVLRSGRQELLFGKQRLVGPLDWVNTRRTFDGFSGIATLKDWTISAFYTQYVVVDQFDFNQPDPQTEFWGAHAAGKVPTTSVGLDLYYLALNRDSSANPPGFNGTAGREDRYTLGGRLSGNLGETAFDYDLEGAYQLGSLGGGDIDAFMIASQLGYKIAELYGGPRPYLGFDYASGDGRAGGNVGTFNQLFPTQHMYQGLIDLIGRQNIIDFSTGFSINLTEKLLFKADGHYFLRASHDDAVYNAAGAVVRADSGGSQDVGGEIDLTFKYPVNVHLFAVIGYSHFFPGEFFEDTGEAKEIDWGYLMLQYMF